MSNIIDARRAWHDAFLNEYNSAKQVAGSSYFSNDQRVVDSVRKAYIQQVVNLIRERDLAAWAWGMYVFAPAGVATRNEISIVEQYIKQDFFRRSKTNFFKIDIAKLMATIRIAMWDVCYFEQTGRYKAHRYDEMASYLHINETEYKKLWLPLFNRLKEITRELSDRALPPVETFLEAYYQARKDGDINTVNQLLGIQRNIEKGW